MRKKGQYTLSIMCSWSKSEGTVSNQINSFGSMSVPGCTKTPVFSAPDVYIVGNNDENGYTLYVKKYIEVELVFRLRCDIFYISLHLCVYE